MADYSVYVTVINGGEGTTIDLVGPGYNESRMGDSATFYNVPEGDNYFARATLGNLQQSEYFDVHGDKSVTITL